MVVLHIERDTEGKNYSISADKDITMSEICFGISAMIKCFLRENLVDSPEILYNMIRKYTEDTSMDEKQETEELSENAETDSN